ncbi:MAG: undecaprenyl-diphosphatase UppP [Candidatus Staskawiczbacteria bacterium]|nr:undecaprenyl-diphosphatase UppP [Candidatus Staskawiczbacteria bacterium]
MDIIQSLILGAVQGITEFLPVSSSGHLVLMQKILGIKEPPIFFDTLIHFATLLAVVYYLRKEIFSIIKGIKQKENQKLVVLIALATVPAVVVGFLLKDKIEGIFNSLDLLSITFLLTALILYATKFLKNSQKELKNANWKDSLFVGIFQALAILPGVSRSGSTISAGLFLGLKREDAFKFSFLLAIPVIFGAMVLQIFDFKTGNLNGGFLVNFTGFLTAVIFGFLSLKILEKIAVRGKLHYFAYYCLALALIIFFI